MLVPSRKGTKRPLTAGVQWKPRAGESELFDNERMQQAGEIGAGRHPDARERLFDGAGAADALACFEDEDALAGAREIGGAGEAVVAGADDDGVPWFCGEFADGCGEAEFAEFFCGG